MSLKYLQNTNRIITSKDYVKQGEKRDKQKVLQRSGAGKPDVSEVTGWPVSTRDACWYLVGRQHGRVPGTFSPGCYHSVVA